MAAEVMTVLGSRFSVDESDRLETFRRLREVSKNVWNGVGVMILPGVSRGDDAIMGAGSVVRRDVLPGITSPVIWPARTRHRARHKRLLRVRITPFNMYNLYMLKG